MSAWKWSCGQWVRRKEHIWQLQLPCLDSFGCHGWTNCSCHAWTTAVAMYNQMWLQCLNNRGWQVWTNMCGMVGPLHVPCWTNYSCHAMTNCYHDRRLLRGTTSANISWQASQLQESSIADRAHQIGMTDHTRSAHAAQQGKKKWKQKTVLHLLLWKSMGDSGFVTVVA